MKRERYEQLPPEYRRTEPTDKTRNRPTFDPNLRFPIAGFGMNDRIFR